MAGMLTVVNPRGRRRNKRRRRATSKRRVNRRRRVHHRASNPVHHVRRRRNPSRRRRSHNRRRRHSNPGLRMGGIVGTLTKGVAIGAGAVATNLAANGVNHFLGANALKGPAKIALKAGVGIVLLPLVLKMVPGGRKFAASVAIGAGVAVALDLYDMVKGSLPSYLQDYQYGSLNAYSYGQLSDWAPQAGMSGEGVYDGGVYS